MVSFNILIERNNSSFKPEIAHNQEGAHFFVENNFLIFLHQPEPYVNININMLLKH